MKVGVFGAGVNGLTTAYQLSKAGHEVTIYAQGASGTFGLTSSNAYAVWTPSQMEDPRVARWSFESLAEYAQLSNVSGSGVRFSKVVDLQVRQFEPWYANRCVNRLPYFRHAIPGEIPPIYPDAHVLESAPVINPSLYLPWLMKEVLTAGGSYEQREISHLEDCPSCFEVLVNCTALGAQDLCGDRVMHPLLMQYVRVKITGQEELTSVTFDQVGPNAQAHIVPHGHLITLGTTYGIGDDLSLVPDDAMTPGILERCSRILPGFEVGPQHVVSVSRCLRPKRLPIRVEAALLRDGRRVYHNYGHDGKSFIVSHGIALEICNCIRSLS